MQAGSGKDLIVPLIHGASCVRSQRRVAELSVRLTRGLLRWGTDDGAELIYVNPTRHCPSHQ